MPSVAQQPRPQLPFAPSNEHGSLSYWRNQIEQSQDKRKSYKEEEWDKNVQSYLGRSLSVFPQYDTVTVPKDFANVERKKAELFFQNPEINLRPKMPGLEDTVSLFQAVINHYLGPDGVDASAMMTEVTFDACMTGLLVSKIGYESFAQGEVPIQVGEAPGPQPPAPPGSMLGLNAPPPPMIPQMQMVPNIVFERYFWERVSPARLLMPLGFSGFNYDRAPWLGFEFEEDWEVVKRRYNLPDNAEPRTGYAPHGSTDLKSEREGTESRASRRVRGQEIWYKASMYHPEVVHPECLYYFVLIEGVEEPVTHTKSPYQDLLPSGELKGMKGFPVHVGALRYVSGSAYPAVESTIGRPQVDELGKSRTQMLNQRDRSVPMRMVDINRIGGEEGADKLRRNVWQGIIPVIGLDQNNPPIQAVQQSHYPPEDFQFNAIIGRDLDEVWAFGSNQRGVETSERKTATEVRNIQANVSTRMDYERRHVVRFFMRGAEKLGSLIQKFADKQDYIQIIGPEGEQRLQVWNKDAIAGEFVYDARPDSAVRVDAAQEFKDLTEMYNLTGRDPHTNRVEILTRMARLKNLDPTKFIRPELPPKGPESPRLSFAFKGEQLDPRIPNFPILLELVRQAGYQISEEAIQAARQHAMAQDQIMTAQAAQGMTVSATTGAKLDPEPEDHGGAALQMERISKHSSEKTGQLSGPRED